MTADSDKRCFRCGRLRKVMMSMKIDDRPIMLCGECYRDFTLFLEGYIVNCLGRIQNDREAEE